MPSLSLQQMLSLLFTRSACQFVCLSEEDLEAFPSQNCRLRDKIDHLYCHNRIDCACLLAIIISIVIISIILIIIIINIMMIIAALQCTTICGLRSAVSVLAAWQRAKAHK